MKKIICFMLLFMTSIIGCSKPKEIKDDSQNKNTSTLEIKEEKVNGIKLVGKIEGDRYIAERFDEKKTIYEYNLSSKELKSIGSVFNKDKFINLSINNDKWVIWVEHESEIPDQFNLPFKWNLVAYNIETKDKYVIDKSTFKSNESRGARFSQVPYEFKLQGDNLAYIRPYKKDGKDSNDVILYNLKTKERKVIDTLDDSSKNSFNSLSFSGNKILWSKLKDCADSKEFAKYNFPFENSELVLYDIEKDKKETIDFKDDALYYYPKLHGDDVLMVRVYEGMEFDSELVSYNLNTKETKVLVNKDSEVYKNRVNETLKSNLMINDKYITWAEDGSGNYFVYDRANKKYINLLKDKNINNEELIINPVFIEDNEIYILGETNKDNINSILKLN